MLRLRLSLIVIIAALFVTGFASAEDKPDKMITLKFLSTWGPNVISTPRQLRPWVDSVNKEMQGRLRIDWVGGPEVISPFEQLKPVQKGVFDLLGTNWAYHAGEVPAGQGTMLFDATAEERRNAGYTQILDEMYQKKANLKLMAEFDGAYRFQIFLNTKIDKADLSGLKIRGTTFYFPVIKALNGAPVVLSASEIYEAMARGVIDGFCWPGVGIVPTKWTEVTKYVVMPGFGWNQNAIFMNLDRWNGLPKSLQDDLTRISQLVEKQVFKDYVEELNPKELQEMTKAGVQIIQLPPEEGKKLVNTFYERTWEEVVLKYDPEYGTRLKAIADRIKNEKK